MFDNFKEHGYLAPIMFFMINGAPKIGLIPRELLINYETKKQLRSIITDICKDKAVTCAGIIIEAYARQFKNDDPLVSLVMDGTLRVSELAVKNDIILMVFSTPETEYQCAYIVDVKNKTIDNALADGELESVGGVFGHFFSERG
jgi:hypothetical protein